MLDEVVLELEAQGQQQEPEKEEKEEDNEKFEFAQKSMNDVEAKLKAIQDLEEEVDMPGLNSRQSEVEREQEQIRNDYLKNSAFEMSKFEEIVSGAKADISEMKKVNSQFEDTIKPRSRMASFDQSP